MKRRLTAILLGLLVLSASIMTSCGEDKGSGAGYLFNYTLVGNPETLDPQLATDTSSKIVIGNLYRGLFSRGDDGIVTEDIANSWEVSADGLEYTVRLHANCYWYSKEIAASEEENPVLTRVTAYDFAFAFERIFNAEMNSPYRETFACLSNAAEIIAGTKDVSTLGVCAENDTTIRFELAYPNADFLSLLATTAALPCNEAFFESCKGRYGLDEDSVIANGDFYLQMWFYDPYGKENEIYMRRNSASCEQNTVLPSNLTFYIADTDATAVSNFEDGETDCLVTSNADYAADSRYTTVAYESCTLGLIFNPESEQYYNADIRAALALGLQRAEYQAELGTDLLSAYAIVPPAVTLLNKSYRELVAELSFAAEDADAAKAAYARALETLDIAALSSTKILVPAGMMDYTVLHTIVRRWNELFDFYIGIEEVAVSAYQERLDAGEYDIALYALTGERNSAAAVLEAFTTEENLFGASASMQEALRGLLNDSQSVASLNETIEIFRAAESCALEETCFVPLFYKREYLVYRTDNEDIHFDPFTGQVFFQDAKHYE